MSFFKLRRIELVFSVLGEIHIGFKVNYAIILDSVFKVLCIGALTRARNATNDKQHLVFSLDECAENHTHNKCKGDDSGDLFFVMVYIS
jgi:hypothetical protein